MIHMSKNEEKLEKPKFRTKGNIIILSITWLTFSIILIYMIYYKISFFSEILTLFAALAAVTGILYTTYKSDLRNYNLLIEQKNNLNIQLRFEYREKAYLSLYREFYDNYLATFDRIHNKDILKEEIKDIITSREKICDFLLEFEKSDNCFFYLDKELLNKIVCLNRIIEENRKNSGNKKEIYFKEYEDVISELEVENSFALKNDNIGNRLKEIKGETIEYLDIKINSVILCTFNNNFELK